MGKTIKKFLALTLVCTLILSNDFSTEQVKAKDTENKSTKSISKENAEDSAYILDCKNILKYNMIQKNYTSEGNEESIILEENNIIVTDLTEDEVETIEDAGIIVEKDICVTGSGKKLSKNQKTKKNKKEYNWNIEAIGVDAVIDDIEPEGDKVKIAILDSGIDFSENINVVKRKNFMEDEVSPLYEDNTGHGTAIAGIIASNGANDTVKGINPNVEIYSARILDSKNQAPISRVVEAIYWAIEEEVKIISISFGTTQYSQILHNAIKEASSKGILIFAASGNQGENENSTVEYPAAFDEVVAVGAADPSGDIADITSRGDELDILAPGINIHSIGWLDMEVVCSGTSMAVPHAVGAASLLWQMDKNKSADFIKGLIKASSKTIASNGKEYSYIDVKYAAEIYEDYSEKFVLYNNIIDKDYNNNDKVYDFSEEVKGSWSRDDHRTTVDYSYNTFNCYYEDVQIVKLGATAPDDYCPVSLYPSHEMFHAKGAHNYVRVCEFIMNLARRCKNYGHQSAMTANCYPDDSNDPDYTTVRSWLNESCIRVMLNNQYEYNDRNASLIMFGVAIHVMGDAYAHKAYEYYDGIIKKPEVNDIDSCNRLYFAKESIMNLWTNYYNDIKTNGTAFEANGNKFRLRKLYTNSIASTNGKSTTWSGFDDLINISCFD